MVKHAEILDRLIQPQRGGFSADHARYILSLDFSDEEQTRYAALSEKAQAGTLSADEQADLDDMLAVNAMLMILQSKARVSLKTHNPAA